MTADRVCVPVAQKDKKKKKHTHTQKKHIMQYTFNIFHSLGKICDKFYAVLSRKCFMLGFFVFWGDTYGIYLSIFLNFYLKKN